MPDIEIVAVSPGCGPEISFLEQPHGPSVGASSTHLFRVDDPAVLQLDLDSPGRGALNHVTIGHDKNTGGPALRIRTPEPVSSIVPPLRPFSRLSIWTKRFDVRRMRAS